MNPYSIVMLNADGALLDSSGRISPNTKKLLNRLERRGIPVILCSSGPPGKVKRTARLCGLHSPAVCYGGSLILDENQNLLADTGIAIQEALRFKQYTVHAFPGLTVAGCLYDIWLTDGIQDPNARKMAEQQGYEAVEGSLRDAAPPDGHVHKLVCLARPVQLIQIQERAAPLFPSLSFAASGAGCLEITAADVSRYTAMETICRFYQAALEQVVAVGSCFADAAMLRHAGLGIAMGNAPEAVRQAAARVTASNDEEGVLIALKNLRFRPPQKGPAD